jgi:hypothetical protein
MAHFVHAVGETLAEVNITLDVAVLTDVEGAVSDEVIDILNVLNRFQWRIGRELAKRTYSTDRWHLDGQDRQRP